MSSKEINVVFLYTEMAGYFVACVEELAKSVSGKILVFHWPVNKEAPFQFSDIQNVEFQDRTQLEDDHILRKIKEANPTIIISSGWMDKGYVKMMKQLRSVPKRVVALDNHWRGDVRQRVAQFASPFTLKKNFNCAWVPGRPQQEFAEKLGFLEILEGFYCADTTRYKSYYQNYFQEKQRQVPKRFLYVGRYVEHKGIFEMWRAFQAVSDQFPDWELWCVGTGDQYKNRLEHPKIKHFGFKQPDELGAFVKQTSVFVMPSKFEPWGVVAQEYAAAGMVLALSDQVGSASMFLQQDVNGYTFEAGSVEAIKDVFVKIMNLPTHELTNMAQESAKIGGEYTPSNWVNKLLSLA